MTQRIEISYKTIVFAVFFVLFLFLIWTIRGLIFALLLAFIFMSALKPIVGKMARSGVPRGLAAFGVVISAVITLVAFIAFLIPPIVAEMVAFITNLPVLLTDSFPFLTPYFNSSTLTQFLPDITQNAFRFVTGVFSNILFVISTFFFSFYFLLDENFFEKLLGPFLEGKRYKKTLEIMEAAEKRMGAWLRGELILMTTIGVLTYIGLFFLNVPFALSLAFIAGLLEVVPIIGPILSAVPAFIVAASSSMWLGIGTLVMYLIVQQLENNVIVPYVMNRAVGIHPVLTLIALSIGGELGGIAGAILAVPVALIIETIITRQT